MLPELARDAGFLSEVPNPPLFLIVGGSMLPFIFKKIHPVFNITENSNVSILLHLKQQSLLRRPNEYRRKTYNSQQTVFRRAKITLYHPPPPPRSLNILCPVKLITAINMPSRLQSEAGSDYYNMRETVFDQPNSY